MLAAAECCSADDLQCAVPIVSLHFQSEPGSLKRMRYFLMSMWGSQKGWTVKSLISSFLLESWENWHFSHPTAVNEAMTKKESSPETPRVHGWTHATGKWAQKISQVEAFWNPRENCPFLHHHPSSAQLQRPGKCHQMAPLAFSKCKFTLHQDGC